RGVRRQADAVRRRRPRKLLRSALRQGRARTMTRAPLSALRRIAAGVLSLLNRRLQKALENLRMTHGIPLGYSNGRTTFDELRVLPDAAIWIGGWSSEAIPDPATVLRGGDVCRCVSSYRTYRPDVAAALGDADRFRGFEAIYAAPAAPAGADLEIRVGDA